MIVRYGNYQHAINTTGLTISQEVLEDEAQVPRSIVTTLNLEGRLRNALPSANPTGLDFKILEMQRAYSVAGQDFGLFNDDGSPTVHVWRNADTIGGIRPKMMAFPKYQGGEYCTYRSFTISLTLTQRPLIYPRYSSFTETIDIQGGGWVADVKEVNFGRGVRQRLRTHEKCTATQSGKAVGRFTYPDVPPPIWPTELVRPEPKINKVARPVGSRSATGRVVLEELEISWVWEFVSTSRLEGDPHYRIA